LGRLRSGKKIKLAFRQLLLLLVMCSLSQQQVQVLNDSLIPLGISAIIVAVELNPTQSKI
jgi:hypothetical protein